MIVIKNIIILNKNYLNKLPNIFNWAFHVIWIVHIHSIISTFDRQEGSKKIVLT